MAGEIANILEEFLNQIKSEMIAHLKNPNGMTAQLFDVEVTETIDGNFSKAIGQLITPLYIEALEIGRGPTVNKTPGNPTLQQKILEWLKINSIMSDKNISQESLSWAMATKIHQEGTLLYRTGGKSGIISQVLTQGRLEAFVEVFGTKASKIILNEIKQTIFK